MSNATSNSYKLTTWYTLSFQVLESRTEGRYIACRIRDERGQFVGKLDNISYRNYLPVKGSVESVVREALSLCEGTLLDGEVAGFYVNVGGLEYNIKNRVMSQLGESGITGGKLRLC